MGKFSKKRERKRHRFLFSRSCVLLTDYERSLENRSGYRSLGEHEREDPDVECPRRREGRKQRKISWKTLTKLGEIIKQRDTNGRRREKK